MATKGDINEFYIIGRGGLPESPTEMLWGQTVWQDLRALEIEGKSQTNRVSVRNLDSSSNRVSISPTWKLPDGW